MSKPLATSVHEWLAKHGYPLEMRVERICREAGFHTTQGTYYTDPDSNEPRETDITAAVTHELQDYFVSATMVIECKSAPGKPYVLFSHATQPPPYFQWTYSSTSDLGQQVLRRLIRVDKSPLLDPFRLQGRTGYGLVQALRDGNRDAAYEALMAVSKAGAQIAARSAASDETLAPLAEFVIPVLAIDGHLFDSHLDDSGNVALQEIDHATVLWRRPVAGRRGTIVRVCTIGALPRLMKAVFAAVQHIADDCHAEVLRAVKTFASRKRADSSGDDDGGAAPGS